MNPIDHPEAWDAIRIGGVVSPGLCEVTGFKRPFGWDKKKGKGAAGETLTFAQLPLAEGTVTFKLWTREHFQAWKTFRPLFKWDPTKKKGSPLDIYYPSLDDLDIKSVVAKEIGAIEKTSKGMYTITIPLIEYRPPPPVAATKTPAGSKTNGSGTQPGKSTDPIADQQQAEIAALLAEAKKP